MSDEIEFLSRDEVCELARIARRTLFRQLAWGKFPKPVYLTTNRHSAAWLRSEVIAWRQQRDIVDCERAASIQKQKAATKERLRRASAEYYLNNRTDLLAKAAAKYAAKKAAARDHGTSEESK